MLELSKGSQPGAILHALLSLFQGSLKLERG